MHFSLSKPPSEYPWQYTKHIDTKHDGKRLNCHVFIHLFINSWICGRCCITNSCHWEYLFLWISMRWMCVVYISLKVSKHSCEWIWMDHFGLSLFHPLLLRSRGMFMAVTNQVIRDPSLDGWRAETACGPMRSPVLPGLGTRGLLLALKEVSGCCPSIFIWWRWTSCLC